MIDWQLTPLAKEYKRKVEVGEEIEIAEFGGGDGFWYDITDGGSFNPAHAIADPEQLAKVMDALKVLEDLQKNVYDKIVGQGW